MPIYQFDNIHVDTNQIELLRDGHTVELEPKSFRVLVYLIDNRTKVVSKDELIQQVWAGAAVTDNALTRVIAQIRKALGDDAKQSRFVETVPTIGYRFIGEIEAVHPDPPAPSDAPRRINWWVPLIAIVAIPMAYFMPFIKEWSAGPPKGLQQVQFTTAPGLDVNPSFSPDGSSMVYASDKTGHFELYVKQVTPGGSEVRLTSDQKENLEPRWSPDGANIAFTSIRNKGIFVVSSLGGPARRLTNFGSQPAWSADSTRVFFRSEGIVSLSLVDQVSANPSVLWSITMDGKLEQVTKQGMPAGRHSMPLASADGKQLGFLSYPALLRPPSLHELDLASGAIQQVSGLDNIAIGSYAYASDRASIYMLAYADRHKFGIYKLDRDPATRQPKGAAQLITPIDFVGLRDLAIHPHANGLRLAYSAVTMSSTLWQTTLEGEQSPLLLERSFRLTQPVFSPNGLKIAYYLRRQGSWGDIYVMDADGSNSIQITRNPAQDYFAFWMPDNQNLIYSTRRESNPSLYRYNFADGSEQRFADLGDNVSTGLLSPDATRVAFHRAVNGKLQVFVKDLASKKVTQLTDGSRSIGFPCWSQDGTQLAVEIRDGETMHAAILPAAGGPLKQLTNRPGLAWTFSFAPDGKKIPIAAKWDESWNLYVVPLDGSQPRKLTNNALERVFLRYPAWSPKDDRIVYERNETTGNIYLAELP